MSTVTSPFHRDRRGTSTALGYVLSLGIAAILISGLIVAGGGLMEGQRDQSARTELQVVGQTLAAELTNAGRLADCPSCELTLWADLPARVAGGAYLIEVVNTADPDIYRLVLSAEVADATATVRFRARRPVATTTVTGGRLAIEYDPAAGTLEVRDA
ncbi:hypothetical protein ACFQL0_08240 [Haloplanus litoreus]|uniref:DUF7266 family protein n=1 Tax=Haloplanus litoreus TaxID=767515 RepID=UPI00361B72DD